jgi:hypothetical protein
MLVLESKIDKLNFGTYMEEYTLPSLEVLISPKEAKAGIVCMKFSYKGDYLAVSFNNEYTEDQVVENDSNGSPLYSVVNESLTIIFQSLSLDDRGTNSSANSAARNQKNDGVDVSNLTSNLRYIAGANTDMSSGAIHHFQPGLSVLFFGLLFALPR